MAFALEETWKDDAFLEIKSTEQELSNLKSDYDYLVTMKEMDDEIRRKREEDTQNKDKKEKKKEDKE
eukprot:CAMPEP_0201534848 /NCGR_PEP_ID=MMETSP0161_2-20130828/57275_1 /ASSEMBLY_ACC=CAM_ASM_000251 /TAXON_ID=180227 /ORGANISM="Neoparamoeba aestuarina, Strain SoJaBio B1-5/56/2" /LENGTH=66 /DNA_ID=CAMNT_0047939679 /DNA_START=90 /DNA_END=287 /DNA_ORIENTATION=+